MMYTRTMEDTIDVRHSALQMNIQVAKVKY